MPKSSYFDFGISIYPQTGEYKIKHRKIMHIIKQCIEKMIHSSNPKYMVKILSNQKDMIYSVPTRKNYLKNIVFSSFFNVICIILWCAIGFEGSTLPKTLFWFEN